MARFARIDPQICAEHLIRKNRRRVPELNLFLSPFGALQTANRRFEAIREFRANRSNLQ